MFDATGYQQNRAYFSQLPFEHIDPLTGNLILTFTNLVLPGNAGLDLRVQLTYNLKSGNSFGGGWTWGLAGVPMRIRFPDAVPPGWLEPETRFPVLVTADAGEHRSIPEIQFGYTGVYRTREFWRYHVAGRRVELPDGRECFYDASGLLTRIVDAFGNRITLDQVEGNLEIRQWFGPDGDSPHRLIVAHGTSQAGLPTAMTFAGRTWTYGRDAEGRLDRVSPPVGPAWVFGYPSPSSSDVSSVTTPGGAKITYAVAPIEFNHMQDGQEPREFSWAITERQVLADGGVAAGTWSYDYDLTAEITTVTEPMERRTVYTHGQPVPAQFAPTEVRRQRKDGSQWVDSEIETRTYKTPGFTDWNNADVQILPWVRTLARDGMTYATTHHYATTDYADYGRPHQTDEAGDLTRVTTRTFDYEFHRWIKDRVKSETVSIDGGGAFTVSAEFENETGFTIEETRHGIRTVFERHADGNVSKAIDPHSHETSLTYEWGALKNVKTPIHAQAGDTITREIDPDGTVKTETRRGFTTTFVYDAVGRLEWLKPATGHWFRTDYDPAGRWIEVSRSGPGKVQKTRYALDGFGRLTGTENSVGVKTARVYDVFGRRRYQSLPFTDHDVGTWLDYDDLDRLREAKTTDDKKITYSYSSGVDVTIVDQLNRTTTQNWAAFGDPGQSRLAGVVDGEGRSWAYAYNTIGLLTRVDQPGAPERMWEYEGGTALLSREVHPESGQTTYTYLGGRLATKTTPRGTFGFGYDANDRVRTIDAPTTDRDLTLDYDDSDNRTLLRVGPAGAPYSTSLFQFDGANRLDWRKDTWSGQPERLTDYHYDGWDNVAKIDYPSGSRSVTYQHDTENRLTEVRREPGNVEVATVLAYHPSRAMAQLRSGNGIVERFDYDHHRYGLERIKDGPIDLTYDYDVTGNVTSVTDGRGVGFNQTFTYDGVDRLRFVTGLGANEFRYDDVGNRTFKQNPQVTYAYDPTTKRLEAAAGPGPNPELGTYTHDGVGNLIGQVPSGGSPATYTYTPFNMLETATVGGATTTYRYDGDNLRIKRIGPGGSELFYRGAGNAVLSEFDDASGVVTWRRDYIYLGTRLVASVSPPVQPITISIVGAAPAVQEEAGVPATVQVRATTGDGQALERTVTVRYDTRDGTATAPADYTAASGTLSFNKDDASGTTKTVSIPIMNETFGDTGETFAVDLSAPTGGAVLALATQTVTITDTDPLLTIDMPGPTPSPAIVGQTFTIAGWAIHQVAPSGSGIDAIHVWAHPLGGGDPIFVGATAPNVNRPDIAAAYGSQFLLSGFQLPATLLVPRTYDIRVHAHSTVTGAFDALKGVRVTVTPDPRMTLDIPQQPPGPHYTVTQPMTIAGWAIDRAAASGTGVDAVHVWAYPNADPTQGAVFVGAAAYGGSRPDIGTAVGAQFANSGFSLNVSLPPGLYLLVVSARSTVAAALDPNQAFNQSQSITVGTNVRLWVDVPVAEATVGQPFTIAGWAFDLNATGGVGIDAIHIWAYPVTPTGYGTPVFAGAAAPGVERPDIAAAYGEPFRFSGWGTSTAGLAPGVYDLIVYARRTGAAQFEPPHVRRVTIQ